MYTLCLREILYNQQLGEHTKTNKHKNKHKQAETRPQGERGDVGAANRSITAAVAGGMKEVRGRREEVHRTSIKPERATSGEDG